MIEFLKLAQATRDPQLKEVPLHKLMESAAKEAGWHLEFNPTLQSREKYYVKYNKPFSSTVTAELVCRMWKTIKPILLTRDIDYSLIDSYLGWGFANFIKTYKPDIHDTDAKIKAAVYRSVQNKLDQCNRKERFRFMSGPDMSSEETRLCEEFGVKPKDYVSYRRGKGELLTPEERVRDIVNGQAEFSKKAHMYSDTPKEISSDTRVGGKDDEGETTLGDFIASPNDDYQELEDMEELVQNYSDDKIQKIVLEFLVNGGSGKVTSRELRAMATKNKTIRIEVCNKINIDISKDKIIEKTGKDNKKEYVDPVSRYIDNNIKKYYRELKSRLAEKYEMSL